MMCCTGATARGFPVIAARLRARSVRPRPVERGVGRRFCVRPHGGGVRMHPSPFTYLCKHPPRALVTLSTSFIDVHVHHTLAAAQHTCALARVLDQCLLQSKAAPLHAAAHTSHQALDTHHSHAISSAAATPKPTSRAPSRHHRVFSQGINTRRSNEAARRNRGAVGYVMSLVLAPVPVRHTLLVLRRFPPRRCRCPAAVAAARAWQVSWRSAEPRSWSSSSSTLVSLRPCCP